VRWWRTSPAGWTRTSLPTRGIGVRKPSTCSCWSEFSECLKRATLLVEAKQKVNYREGGRSGFPNQWPWSGRSTALSDQTLGAHSKGRVARGCSETLAQQSGLGRAPVTPRLGTSVAIFIGPSETARATSTDPWEGFFGPCRKAMGSASETCFAEVGTEIHQEGPRSEAAVAKQHERPGGVLLLTPVSEQARFRRRFARQRKRKDAGGAS